MTNSSEIPNSSIDSDIAEIQELCEKVNPYRLRVDASLLRKSSAGMVGADAPHWMKEIADDCEQAANQLSLARTIVPKLLARISDAELALAHWDEGRASEYWERHSKLLAEREGREDHGSYGSPNDLSPPRANLEGSEP